ncbi:DUF6090 family protein [Winogradskyella sp. MIT101101]|uniref:DUF6090 family protein n=1 Tax=Winogradskyella sp. MIT101101 TaxID=3098297 RepID=UPI00399AE2C9
MIKFFRHIRQSMINQNRTKKYLLYAIGEIILVVIGILIALQINNWNENRKTDNDFRDKLVLIKSELNQDIAFYQELKLLSEERIIFFTSLYNKEYPDLDLTTTATKISKNFNPRKFGTGYSSIKSESHLKKINNQELKNSLIKYYEETALNYNDLSEWHKEFVKDNIDIYILKNLQMDIQGKVKPELIIYEMEDKILPSILSFQVLIMKRFKEMATVNITNAKKLNDLIDQELKES